MKRYRKKATGDIYFVQTFDEFLDVSAQARQRAKESPRRGKSRNHFNWNSQEFFWYSSQSIGVFDENGYDRLFTPDRVLVWSNQGHTPFVAYQVVLDMTFDFVPDTTEPV